MLQSYRHRIPVTYLLIIITLAFIAHASFQPERMYRLRKKISLNQDWKFFRNTPEGNAFETAYNDAAWETVNVPHSAMYVPPTPAGEATTMPADGSAWTGISWYRKTFTVPQGDHTQRVFLEFEGAMQSADVYLNGERIGGHGASGYTAFGFDISEA
ncbi:MAG: beta galactosidase jelly roll domain-containing protein, partial [Chitinispirillaceae bacterium]|nr:beta galactosidase jelly roll domain-containing protein [Chitinispirillaceae bacterium]